MNSDTYAQGAAQRDAEPAPGEAAERFAARLRALGSAEVRRQLRRHFRAVDAGWPAYDGRILLGVRIESVIGLAREHAGLDPAEIEALLGFDEHEVRAGGLWVMGRQARAALPIRRVRASVSPLAGRGDRLEELYELYLRRIDRIDNWDLVDLAAPDVVGGHLLDRSRSVLYEMARSGNRWERRTALLGAFRLVRAGDLEDACALCFLLLGDPDELVQAPIGGVLREVGRRDRARLQAFLDAAGARVGQVALRYAMGGLNR